ncbi:unnamed protein product [Cochlearia groenlandica]
MAYHIDINELNLKDTELRLGLPGTEEHKQEQEEVSCVTSNKRQFHNINNHNVKEEESSPPTKTQIIGWPPVRSNRKNNNNMINVSYVKVSMDGAPYLRKIDLKIYKNYNEILKALENMFKFNINIGEGYKRCGFLMTYQDKDGDWMLVGDVPWDMFSSSCQKLRIMKQSEAPMK